MIKNTSFSSLNGQENGGGCYCSLELLPYCRLVFIWSLLHAILHYCWKDGLPALKDIYTWGGGSDLNYCVFGETSNDGLY